MRAAIIVARELLRCRLAEGGRDALLEWVAKLLDAAYRGAAPFCSLSTPCMVAEACARPQRTHAHHRALKGFDCNNTALAAAHPAATTVPPARAGPGGPLRGHTGASPRDHQGQAQVPEIQGVGHPREGPGVAAPDAYVALMMDL